MKRKELTPRVETKAGIKPTNESATDQTINFEDDVERWRAGAEQFRTFWRGLPPETLTRIKSLTDSGLAASQKHLIGCIQALFLGEKPAYLGGKIIPNEYLQKFNLKKQDDYIYSPDQVATVMAAHPEVFLPLHCTTPEELMLLLSRDIPTTPNIAHGLVLGFPMKSIQAYESANQLQIRDVMDKIFTLVDRTSPDMETILDYWGGGKLPEERIRYQPLIDLFIRLVNQLHPQLGITTDDLPRLTDELRHCMDAKAVNVYGVTWVDFEPSTESRDKQVRLRAAFEKSGILEADMV